MYIICMYIYNIHWAVFTFMSVLAMLKTANCLRV